jgi:outer membrane immunogenic protein
MRINHLLLSSLLIVGASTTAFAADAPDNNTPPMPDASTFTWSGAYAGLNVGGAFDAKTRFNRTTGDLANNSQALGAGLRPTTHTIRDSGVTAGGQIGYNYQIGTFDDNGLAMVLGGEADIAYTDLKRTDTLSNTSNLGPLVTPTNTSFTRVNQYQSKMDYFGTARGRLGIASKHVFAYGTAGFAYGHIKRDIVYYGPNSSTPFFAGSNNGTKTGYVYGGGVEFAVPTNSFLSRLSFFHTSAVTLKAEFIRYHLGNDTLVFPGVNGGATIGGYSARVHNSGDIARAGINYKF